MILILTFISIALSVNVRVSTLSNAYEFNLDPTGSISRQPQRARSPVCVREAEALLLKANPFFRNKRLRWIRDGKECITSSPVEDGDEFTVAVIPEDEPDPRVF